MLKRRRRKVRFVRQAALADCGLACIAMAASAYGCDIALAELCKRFPPTLRGMTVKQVVNVARELGFEADAVAFELNGLQELHLPAILHWRGNHFVVVSDVNEGGITVLDPIWGRRRYKFEQLPEFLSGIAIEMQPTDRVHVGSIGQHENAFWPIIDEVKALRADFLQIVLIALYLEALVVAVPLLVSRLINTFSKDAQPSAPELVVWALFVGIAALWALRAYRSVALVHLGTKVKFRFISKLVPRLLSKPYSFFRQRSVADLMYRLNGAEQFRNIISDECVSVAADAVMAIVVLLAMAYLNPTIALISLAAVVLITCVRFVLARGDVGRFDEIIHLRGTESIFVQETLRAARAIKLFGQEDERATLWGRRVKRTLAQEIKHSRSAVLSNVVPAAAAELVVVATIIFQIMFAQHSQVTVGAIFAFYVYQKLVFDRCLAIASRVAQFSILQLYMNRMADVLDESDAQVVRPRKQVDWTRAGVVLEVESLSFRFGQDNPWTLENISFSIEAGQFVGIYGRSGAGKTTLIEILLGVREGYAGTVRWVGAEINDIDLTILRNSVAALTQDDVVLMGTVEENITFFAAAPDDARMQRAAQMAKLEDDVLAMPLRYSTPVGESGSALSGGQRQRLLLARALYTEPKVLVIDEGTNEIDASTEAEIYANLRRLGITVIVVAHRRETLRLAQRLMLLEDGCLIESDRALVRGAEARV